MADNASGPVQPVSSPSAGRRPPPLPAKKSASKVVVLLSSVAKPAPSLPQTSISVAHPTPEPSPVMGSNTPRTQSTGEIKLPPAGQGGPSRWPSLSGSPVGTPRPAIRSQAPPMVTPSVKMTTPIVLKPEVAKPPPVPVHVLKSGPPKAASIPETAVSKTHPKPAETSALAAPKKAVGRQIPPIKLGEPTQDKASPGDSIFADIPEPEAQPAGWQALQPGDLKELSSTTVNSDAFIRSPENLPKIERPGVATKTNETKIDARAVTSPITVAKAKPMERPPLAPTPVTVTPPPLSLSPAATIPEKRAEEKTPPLPAGTNSLDVPAGNPVRTPVRPPPLPVRREEKSPPTLLHVAPPLAESESVSNPEKLRPPHLPSEATSDEGKLPQPHLPSATTPETGKLPQPHLRPEERQEKDKPLPAPAMTSIMVALETPDAGPALKTSSESPVLKVPATPPPLPGKKESGLRPVPTPSSGGAVLKVSGPIVLRGKTESELRASSKNSQVLPQIDTIKSSQVLKGKVSQPLASDETKPALRPAVLPNKLLKANEVEATKSQVEALKKMSANLAVIRKASPTPFAEPTVKVKPVEMKGPEIPVVAKAPLTLLPAALPPKLPVKVEPVPVVGVSLVAAKESTLTQPASGTIAKETPSTAVPVAAGKVTPPSAVKPPALPKKAKLPLTRAERAKRRRLVGMITYYIIMFAVGGFLYWGAIFFSRETRVEGQVIPPEGSLLVDEVWLVNDFRDSVSGLVDDMAEERAPMLQEIRYRQDHAQRAQSDIALREGRVRDLQTKIDATKAEATEVVRSAREATQHVWDDKGAELDAQYEAQLSSVRNAIAERAKAMKLDYKTDETYQSPEVWANAYRLALYQVPQGVDSSKEYQWLTDQLKQWRAFLKTMDASKQKLREEAAQIKLSPATKLAALNGKVEDLQHRIDTALAEEEPIKTELQQARSDLDQAITSESGLDAKYFPRLHAQPGYNVLKRLPLASNGRFGWSEDTPFSEDEKERRFWIFARAIRPDGTQFWTMERIAVVKNTIGAVIIEPGSFTSTKTLLHPSELVDDPK